MLIRRAYLGVPCWLIMTMGMSVADASDYPARPVRFVVAQPPGGGTDVVARMLAQRMSEVFKQQVVIDNRPGAGGIVGTELVSKARPDGYTLLLGYTGSLTINPALHKKLPYHRVRDFDPVSLAVASPLMLTVHPSVKAGSFGDLIALAKARAGTPLNYASPGNGSLHHLSIEWIKSAMGVELVHIPYKGAASFNSVVAGQTQLGFVSLVSGLPQVKAGRARALAVTSKTRSPMLPDVPALAEVGLPDFDARNWFGVLVPKGTPKSTIDTLSSVIMEYMRMPQTQARVLEGGSEAIGSTPAEFSELIRREGERWAKVVQQAGMAVD